MLLRCICGGKDFICVVNRRRRQMLNNMASFHGFPQEKAREGERKKTCVNTVKRK